MAETETKKTESEIKQCVSECKTGNTTNNSTDKDINHPSNGTTTTENKVNTNLTTKRRSSLRLQRKAEIKSKLSHSLELVENDAPVVNPFEDGGKPEKTAVNESNLEHSITECQVITPTENFYPQKTKHGEIDLPDDKTESREDIKNNDNTFDSSHKPVFKTTSYVKSDTEELADNGYHPKISPFTGSKKAAHSQCDKLDDFVNFNDTPAKNLRSSNSRPKCKSTDDVESKNKNKPTPVYLNNSDSVPTEIAKDKHVFHTDVTRKRSKSLEITPVCGIPKKTDRPKSKLKWYLDPEEEEQYAQVRRKKLRGQVCRDQLWEGIPTVMKIPRLKNKTAPSVSSNLKHNISMSHVNQSSSDCDIQPTKSVANVDTKVRVFAELNVPPDKPDYQSTSPKLLDRATDGNTNNAAHEKCPLLENKQEFNEYPDTTNVPKISYVDASKNGNDQQTVERNIVQIGKMNNIQDDNLLDPEKCVASSNGSTRKSPEPSAITEEKVYLQPNLETLTAESELTCDFVKCPKENIHVIVKDDRPNHIFDSSTIDCDNSSICSTCANKQAMPTISSLGATGIQAPPTIIPKSHNVVVESENKCKINASISNEQLNCESPIPIERNLDPESPIPNEQNLDPVISVEETHDSSISNEQNNGSHLSGDDVHTCGSPMSNKQNRDSPISDKIPIQQNLDPAFSVEETNVSCSSISNKQNDGSPISDGKIYDSLMSNKQNRESPIPNIDISDDGDPKDSASSRPSTPIEASGADNSPTISRQSETEGEFKTPKRSVSASSSETCMVTRLKAKTPEHFGLDRQSIEKRLVKSVWEMDSNRKKKTQTARILKDKRLEKHAFTIWFSEQRRCFQQEHQGESSGRLNKKMQLAWEKLRDQEKLRFFIRAQNALEDKKDSSVKNSLHFQCAVEKETRATCADPCFSMMAKDQQDKILKQNLIRLQKELNSVQYHNFLSGYFKSFRRMKMRLKKRHHLVSNTKIQSLARRLLYEVICEAWVRLSYDRLGPSLSSRYHALTGLYQDLISGILNDTNLHVPGDCSSTLLSDTLENLQNFENFGVHTNVDVGAEKEINRITNYLEHGSLSGLLQIEIDGEVQIVPDFEKHFFVKNVLSDIWSHGDLSELTADDVDAYFESRNFDHVNDKEQTVQNLADILLSEAKTTTCRGHILQYELDEDNVFEQSQAISSLLLYDGICGQR